MLSQITQKGLGIFQKEFMVYFLAFSFFVIPEFRREILDLIGYRFDKNKSMESEILMILFNWNIDFYEKL